MPLATSFSIDLIPGEVVKIAGPGTLKFQAAEMAATATTAQAVNAAQGAGTAKAGVLIGQKGAATAATGQATAAKGVGTIWTGKGLSLGLGLGLGAWGPVLLASAVTLGGYAYWRKKQAERLWPF